MKLFKQQQQQQVDTRNKVRVKYLFSISCTNHNLTDCLLFGAVNWQNAVGKSTDSGVDVGFDYKAIKV